MLSLKKNKNKFQFIFEIIYCYCDPRPGTKELQLFALRCNMDMVDPIKAVSADTAF